MRVVLRLVSVLFVLATLLTGLMLLDIVARGKLLTLAQAGVVGVWTLIGWILILALGLPAAVQLWRLRPSGRTLGIILAASSLAYHLFGPLIARQMGLAGRYTPQVLLGIFGNGALVTLLVSGAARRACLARGLEERGA